MKLRKILLGLFCVYRISADPFFSQWIQQTQNGLHIDYTQAQVFSNTLSYTQGGIQFTYPAGYFSTAPTVYLSITLQNLTYSPYLMVAPIVVANSANGTQVFVNTHTPGMLTNFVAEANTKDVYVTIFAFGT